MNKIFNRLANIPHDKLLHFFYGTLMAAPLVAFTGPLFSSAVMIVIAFGKELYDDLSGNGNLELLDALYTIAPVVIINTIKYI